jgi:hypothetical protein
MQLKHRYLNILQSYLYALALLAKLHQPEENILEYTLAYFYHCKDETKRF